nr:hypothetical protein CFP56_53054 [Quercus suber]
MPDDAAVEVSVPECTTIPSGDDSVWADRELEREIYGRPFTTVRPVPSNTDEEIVVLIADLTQPDEAWS